MRIHCERWARAGRYRLDGLVARFGADMDLPDVLMALAAGALLAALRDAVYGLGGAVLGWLN